MPLDRPFPSAPLGVYRTVVAGQTTTPGDDAKKAKKTLELKTPENRFAFTSAEALEEAQKGVVPENTKKATEWAQ